MSDIKVNEMQQPSISQKLFEISNRYYFHIASKAVIYAYLCSENEAEIAVFAFFGSGKPYNSTAKSRKTSGKK